MCNMNKKQVKINESIQKGFLIIETMANSGVEMKLQDIAIKTSLPQATALRILYTLMTLGYVSQNENNMKYFLTLKLTFIGRKIESKLDIRRIIKPHLEEISRITGEASCLSIEYNNELVYIDSVDGEDNILTVTQKIGKKAPLYCTAAGKLYLSEKTQEEIDTLFLNNSLVRLTEHTIVTKFGLISSVEKARQDGYALDNEECELGVRCVAIPIRKFDSKIIATISVTGPIFRLTFEKIEIIKSLLLKESKKIEHILSHNKDA